MPAATVGYEVMVTNASTNSAHLYGAGSDTIDGTAGATGIVIAVGSQITFYCVAAATWVSSQANVYSAPVFAGSVTGTYTLAGTPTITAPTINAYTITGTGTIGNGCTLTTPAISGATISGTVTVANGATLTTPLVTAGTGIGTIIPAGVIHVDTTSTGNGTDQTEDTLTTYSLPANTLVVNGKGLKIRAWGIYATSGDTKQAKLYFGSEVVATGAVTTSNKGWYLELEVYRTNTGAQVVFGNGLTDTTSITPLITTGSETETAGITIKITGQNTSNNVVAVTAKALVVEFLN